METTAVAVPRAPKRLWSPEKKMAVLQEWPEGVPLEEVCRTHGVHASQVYKWKRALIGGYRTAAPSSQRARWWPCRSGSRSWSGRWAARPWKPKVLKKACELKGLKLPEGT